MVGEDFIGMTGSLEMFVWGKKFELIRSREAAKFFFSSGQST